MTNIADTREIAEKLVYNIFHAARISRLAAFHLIADIQCALDNVIREYSDLNQRREKEIKNLNSETQMKHTPTHYGVLEVGSDSTLAICGKRWLKSSWLEENVTCRVCKKILNQEPKGTKMKLKPNFLNERWRVEFDSDPATSDNTVMADVGQDYPVCIADIPDIDGFNKDRAALMAAAPAMKKVCLEVMKIDAHRQFRTPNMDVSEIDFDELAKMARDALDRALIADDLK